MKWEWEPWRKLYLREPIEQLLWPVLTRGLRDYLIRRADDDGRLCLLEDLFAALGVRDTERDMVRDAVEKLLADRFLVTGGQDGALYIRNMRDAQERRSKEAIRKQRQRDKKKMPSSPGTSGGTSEGDTSGGHQGATNPGIRSDPRDPRDPREAPLPPAPSAYALSDPADPTAAAVLNQLRKHRILDGLPLQRIAENHAGFMATAGQRLPLVLEAIDDCAAKMPDGLTVEARMSKLVGFMRKAHVIGAKVNGVNGTHDDKPKNYEAPKLSKEQRETQKRQAEERMRKLEEATKKKKPEEPRPEPPEAS